MGDLILQHFIFFHMICQTIVMSMYNIFVCLSSVSVCLSVLIGRVNRLTTKIMTVMFAHEKKVMENSYNTESLSNCDLTLTMVPDGVESRATARLTEFLNRKNVTAGGKPVWSYFGTLPGVMLILVSKIGQKAKRKKKFAMWGRCLWGRCPSLTPPLYWITPSRASGTADHVRSLDDLLLFQRFWAFWAYGSYPDALVTFSSTAPAHPHATTILEKSLSASYVIG